MIFRAFIFILFLHFCDSLIATYNNVFARSNVSVTDLFRFFFFRKRSCRSRCSSFFVVTVASRQSRAPGAFLIDRTMARGRAAVTFSIVILAVACLVVRVKAEAASLNETIHNDDVIAQNEVPLSHESENKNDELSSHEHPHNVHGKPTKFDLKYNADDNAEYQIETTRIANVTANPIEMDSTINQSLSNSTSECDDKLTVSCIGKNFFNFLDHLSRVDTYNVTDSVQIIRNPEADVACNERNNDDDPDSKLDEVHHYVGTHMMKIQLNKDLNLARKARTFFGCEFLDRLATGFVVACVLVPLHLPRKVDFSDNASRYPRTGR